MGSTILFTLEPLLVLRTLGIDPSIFGVALSVGAVGGLAGSVVAPRLARRIGEGPTLRWMILLSVAGSALLPLLVVFPRAWTVAVLCLTSVVFSFSVVVYNVIQVTARQRLCPRELLGRMNASIRFVVWGVMPLAALLAGWLGTTIGLIGALWVGVGVAALSCLPLWVGSVGRLRTFHDS